MGRARLRRQHALRRISLDERISIEVRGDDVRPLIEDSMQCIVVLDIEHRDRTSSGARLDVPAFPARLVSGNPRPERLPGADQIGRPLRPRCRDHQKQHDRILPAWLSDRNA